jgi:hypothetical protein
VSFGALERPEAVLRCARRRTLAPSVWDGDRGPLWAGAARGPQTRGSGPLPLPLENDSLN